MGALLAALVAIAFLVGREAGRQPGIEDSAEPPVPLTGDVAPAAAAVRPRPTLPAPSPPSSPPAAVGDSRQREQIESCFRTVDRLGASGAAGDPEKMATAIVGEEASGNWSTFDDVADTQRTNLAQLQQMNVPPDARAYHDQTTRLMEAGIDMMTKVKRGMERGDAMALTALSTEAQAMQVDAEAAERLGAELRAKYGILAR